MLAIITRPMVIATDAGTSKQYLPLRDQGTGEDVPQTVSEGEFGRLRRAGAAARFIEVNHAETEAEPPEGDILQAMAQPGLGEDRVQLSSPREQTEPSGTASGEAVSEGDPGGITSQLPVKPAKGGRKPKG